MLGVKTVNISQFNKKPHLFSTNRCFLINLCCFSKIYMKNTFWAPINVPKSLTWRVREGKIRPS